MKAHDQILSLAKTNGVVLDTDTITVGKTVRKAAPYFKAMISKGLVVVCQGDNEFPLAVKLNA